MTGWARLAELVVARRRQLGYRSRTALAAAGGISLRTLGDIECGRRPGYRPATLAALELVLRWRTGSALRVVAGGHAEPVDAQPDIPITFLWL